MDCLNIPTQLISLSLLAPTLWVVVAILCLFFASSPATITWFIVSVVVYTFQSVLWGRGIAHIGKECLKRFLPLIANFYPSFSIPSVMRVFGIVATLTHRNPDAVFSKNFTIRCKVVGGDGINLKTTATSLFAKSQISRSNRYYIPTFTFTSPSCLLPFVFIAANHSEPRECLSNQIIKFTHISYSLWQIIKSVIWNIIPYV